MALTNAERQANYRKRQKDMKQEISNYTIEKLNDAIKAETDWYKATGDDMHKAELKAHTTLKAVMVCLIGDLKQSNKFAMIEESLQQLESEMKRIHEKFKEI